MHSFEVHSNESACRKSGRLGMEQVQCGLLYLFPDLEVYYNPQYISNLLFMSVVTSKYDVNMDIGVKGAITLHLEIIRKLNSLLAAMKYITLIPPTLSPCKRLQIISPKMKQLINLKAPLPATHLYPLLPPIKNVLLNVKLKKRIMHD